MQRLNKQVLNGFIQQAVSHNKYLEEQEMWKKRESSVSGKRKKRHKSREKMPRTRSPSPSDDEIKKDAPKSSRTPEELDDLKAILALYKSAKESNSEKWGHSGFNELYPDFKPVSCEEKKKLSIDDSLDLINEQTNKAKKEKTSKSRKKKKKSKKHKSNEDLSKSDNLTENSSIKSDESSKFRSKKKSKKRKNVN